VLLVKLIATTREEQEEEVSDKIGLAERLATSINRLENSMRIVGLFKGDPNEIKPGLNEAH
jgi:hypothetical protein